jgi:hypothetical protein
MDKKEEVYYAQVVHERWVDLNASGNSKALMSTYYLTKIPMRTMDSPTAADPLNLRTTFYSD